MTQRNRKHGGDVRKVSQTQKSRECMLTPNALQIILNSSAETQEDLSKSFSPAWLTIPSWMMSISLTEVEMKCFTSKRFIRREKDMLYVKKNKADLLGKVTSNVGIEIQQVFLKECT
ncbi:hypothetical protein Tco_0676215 [Tanacetum coccineum]